MQIEMKKNHNASKEYRTKYDGKTPSRRFAKSKSKMKKHLHRTARRIVNFEMK